MSTLPFLLSVADELDNLNSQNYLDDFGLGFHPHRQYYRTPTIQLSLPASTEWMEQEQGRHHSRYRSTYRYYGEPQNNLPEGDEEDNEDRDNASHDNEGAGAGSSMAQKYVSALNSNTEKDEIIDNSLQLYNISKKCSKDYYRHNEPRSSSATATVTASSISTAASSSTSISKPPPLPPRSSKAAATASKANETKPNMSYRLHSKCLEGNNSSSEESLQKVTSSIEFLTCFLLKKTRVSKSPAGPDGKKS